MKKILSLFCLAVVAAMTTQTTAANRTSSWDLNDETDAFYVFITSDPQYPYISTGDYRLTTYGMSQDTLSNRFIESQYSSIRDIKWMVENDRTKTNRVLGINQIDPVRGLIINGDLTNWGHEGEMGRMLQLWRILDGRDYYHGSAGGWSRPFHQGLAMHLFMGLGNHDYEMNINDCNNNNCADRMWTFMQNHYDDQCNGPAWFSNAFPLSYTPSSPDSRRRCDDIRINELYERRLNWQMGSEESMWYSFRLGGRYGNADRGTRMPMWSRNEVSGVRFIQMQNSPGYETTWRSGNGPDINIRPDYYWLENELREARRTGEAIIFLDHVGGMTSELARMAKQYGVAAWFSGHYHTSLGQDPTPFWWPEHTPQFLSGGSMEGNMTDAAGMPADSSYLLVRFDLSTLDSEGNPAPEFKVWKVGSYVYQRRTTIELEGTYPLYPVSYAHHYRDREIRETPELANFHLQPGPIPLPSGRTTIWNNIGGGQEVRIKMRCLLCFGQVYYESGWNHLWDTQQRDYTIRTAWPAPLSSSHDFIVQWMDHGEGVWKGIDMAMEFPYVVDRRCIKIWKRKDTSLDSNWESIEVESIVWEPTCPP